ncbi:MAG TPA: excinuclease ABC subunit UvrC [Nitrosomonas nitrosa]|uniref:UvrABC system protein C n=1 Tax=Nitrosomonas nitrosa TaxID=52442 RepID=A0A8H8YYB2_9PROT|nr:excinuclease ABC subunit UvrC [Nitrosomonas nitrosa]MCO6433434.1 excinuclease ABC subunit UvrC [Nitrosomonas nitrosa]PTQ98355.1 excinuclease ABC subunit C [Nitrosomonas nitrosa]CAE6491656.1 excinuclease UvrABC, endonuclease subunit [Nitrosomonas nitrosa]HBZ29877.1 excinuclease ABC subunit UvrC [Nitrosomonas nitrosa]HNP50212.1 excinuclease ABC subunit UvrC [Nitrosomonas nitrosa]
MSEITFDGKVFSSTLPPLPGVYRMLNAAGEVIYVGKAIDLRKRVSSYFQKSNLSPRIQLMVSQIVGIETTVTRSEAEALLLENNLIKSLAPRYNILFRDDKSYPYLMLSRHAYPRLAFYRGMLDSQHQYFGPFPNAGVVRESIHLLQKVFRLRTCEDSVFNHRARPCLLYQIKRCSGPCVNLISQDEYREDVKSASLFLQGKQNEVLKAIAEKMQIAAERMEYEQAAIFRDQMQALRKIQEKQFVDSGKALDVDVIACTSLQEGDGNVCVNLVMIRGGRHLGDKSFFPQNVQGYTLADVLEAFITQHYINRPIPPMIVIDEKIALDVLQPLLSEQAGRKVAIVINPAGERRAWLRMATENARLALKQRLQRQASQEDRLQALQFALNLPSLGRIECFDISHTMGEATVASCVVYDNFALRNNEYRRYNITDIMPGDDYAAMRQALLRRYKKIAEDEGKLPDLILIDGGKGQVSAAQEVLIELGLNDIPFIGVAKGEERKPGLEQLIFPSTEKSLKLPPDHAGLHLIQQIRDEAHRFAIQGHRARRNKSRTHSSLEQIAGIGAKRRQSLLGRFGGLKGVLTASIEELQQAEGISRALAERIYRELH